MIGYHTHSGGKWSGDYFVVSKDDYCNTEVERDTHIQRVKEVFPHKSLVFAATTRQFRRAYEFDDGRRESFAEEPIELDRIVAQDISETHEGETEAAEVPLPA